MNYPLSKYHFYKNGNRTIAVSTYAGKSVRGVSICHPDDQYSEEIGQRIAAARCNEKIANKRLQRAQMKRDMARKAFEDASAHLAEMQAYFNDAYVAYNSAAQEHDQLIASLRTKD